MLSPRTRLVAGGIVLGGCSLAESGLLTVLDASVSDVSQPDVGASDSSDEDAAVVADVVSEPIACPTNLPGSPMVAVVDYCIDTTEVTFAQFAAFAASDDGGQLAPPCDWATGAGDYRTYTGYDGGNGTNPVVNMNWCGASAYCHAAGKRLCGSRTGGRLSVADIWNPTKSQWFFACSPDGGAYPYGNTFNAGYCQGSGTAPAPVGSHPQCQGGVSGIYDMSGNVWEWLDSCDLTGSEAANNCTVQGGSYRSADTPGALRCDTAVTGMRSDRLNNVGFRCCWP